MAIRDTEAPRRRPTAAQPHATKSGTSYCITHHYCYYYCSDCLIVCWSKRHCARENSIGSWILFAVEAIANYLRFGWKVIGFVFDCQRDKCNSDIDNVEQFFNMCGVTQTALTMMMTVLWSMRCGQNVWRAFFFLSKIHKIIICY